MPFKNDEMAILHQTPFNPKIGVSKSANGIRKPVKTMEITAGTFGNPMPEYTPVVIISIAINICDSPIMIK